MNAEHDDGYIKSLFSFQHDSNNSRIIGENYEESGTYIDLKRISN